jgi:hypothetical protein
MLCIVQSGGLVVRSEATITTTSSTAAAVDIASSAASFTGNSVVATVSALDTQQLFDSRSVGVTPRCVCAPPLL